ncbi:inhibitor of growth protein 3-like isoform X2 [Ornithodoros turicata]|uniref:inhibitor of growth protein 3-like isoform X2 n=1 Tax=Ornithodoros turicata TaxID=34597 RepID=UPI003138A249
MLYLEDYLEMIEHLPQELRDRFTEMREMDLQVQNAMDSLDERVKQFFANVKKMKPEQREQDFDKIRQDYYKALEDADEKVQIANQIYDLVDRYLRRLDQELQKFKMELEADNAGITEILERRSLELDKPPPATNNVKSEKRKYTSSGLSSSSLPPEKRQATDRPILEGSLGGTGGISGARGALAASLGASQASPAVAVQPLAAAVSPAPVSQVASERLLVPSPALGYSLGSGSNAIAAAASQAIAATQQMQQGRRTASLKASYEAINASLQSLTSREFTMGSKDIGSLTSLTPPPPTLAQTPPAHSPAPETKRSSKKQSSRTSHQAAVVAMEQPVVADDSGDSSLLDEGGASGLDWNCDPNEPRYCICNQVSYGDMVACDNDDCPFEWFHYPCVGISQPPKGKWFCPQCTSSMKRRGRKER